MATINDLPIELYQFIFRNYLSIQDLFNCRLVNKKFKQSTYECVNRLVINESDIRENRWFYNNELINDDDVISFECFKEIRSRSIFNLNKYLKYLKITFDINNYQKLKNELSNLNNLINLESLEIYSNYYDRFDDIKLDLNLKNLKYFKFCINGKNNVCELNAPKLEKIEFRSKSDILIKSNPESIKHLITQNYDDELRIFKNLEIIEFKDGNNLNENLSSYFNNLKQLKIHDYNYYRPTGLIEKLKKIKKLDRDIDIYLYGNN